MKATIFSSLLAVLALGPMAVKTDVALLEAPHGLAIDSAGHLLVS